MTQPDPTGPTAEVYQAAADAWVRGRAPAMHAEALSSHPVLCAMVDAVWPLAVAEGRRQAAARIRSHAATIATHAEAEAGVTAGTADAHPLLLGLEFAARVAEALS